MLDDRTIESTITETEIVMAEVAYESNIEAIEALERLIGTYETYGNFVIVRPEFSKKVA